MQMSAAYVFGVEIKNNPDVRKKNKKVIFKKEILFNFLGQIKLKKQFRLKTVASSFRFIFKGS